jgi:SAM-dependent methyltransferase
MPEISNEIIRKIVLEDNDFFIPERITKAIGQSVTSNVDDVSVEINSLIGIYKKFITSDEPTRIDYSKDTTIDAYVIHYLPRSTIIPKLLFLFLSYHPAFKTIKKNINILDLGSGTGGVILGLLDLFENDIFSDIKTNIVSCDISPQALDRQKTLCQITNYKHNNIQYLCKDLTDDLTYDKYLTKYAPYDYIIAANLFAELSLHNTGVLLSKVSNMLAPNGVLLIADPPRHHIDKSKILTLNTLRDLGFSAYYPCPPGYNCPKSECQWVWLNFDLKCPDIELKGDILETNKSLSTTWSIYCRTRHSIYDILKAFSNELTWGVAVPIGKELSMEEKIDYSICTSDGPHKAVHTRKKALFRSRSEVILRGSILGHNDDYTKVNIWYPTYGLQ